MLITSRQKSVFRSVLALGASLGALSLGSAALAQEAADTAPQQAAEPVTAADIIVTAQFRAQNLQDTPLAITAVDAATLAARSQTSLTDVANQAPSVVLRPQGGSFGPSITANIRGLGQADFNPAFEPGVGLYIDDVYYPRLTGANFDLLDVERVEILRGPQGTLTGRNSEGGAIKFISRKPSGDGSGYIEATYGSRNRINMRGGADFTIAKDLFARISGTFRDQEGYVDRIDYGCANPSSGIPTTRAGGDCVVSKHGSIGYQAVRGIVRYNPSEAIDLMISADYIHDERTQAPEVLLYANLDNANTNPVAGVPFDSRFICGRYCHYGAWSQPSAAWAGPVAPGFPLVASAADDRSIYKGWGVSGNAEIGLTEALQLVSITAYREFDTRFNSDDDLSPANIGFGQNHLDHWFFSQELRLNGEIGDNVDFTLGGFYSDERTTYFTYQDIRYAPIPLQFVGNDPVDADSKAVFGTVIWRPLDAMTLTGGLRYTDESKTYTFVRKDPTGTMPNAFLGALDGVVGRYSGDRVDYRVSLDYRFAPEVLAYATVSTGFKGGGIGPRPFNAAQARPFGPEKLTAYEIGLKTDLFDRKVRLNLSAFFNEFTDAQLTLLSCPQFGGPGPCALPQNAGNAEIKGFEAELTATPIDGLSIDGSLSYVDWKWKCVNIQVVRPLAAGEQDSCSSDPSIIGRLNPQPPVKWKWSLGVQYVIPVGNMGSLTPRFDISYQGSLLGSTLMPTDPTIASLTRIPSFELANARLTWRNDEGDWEASLEVTNLFKKYYFLTNFDLTGAGAGIIKGQPGRPREWAITVKKKF